MKARVYFSLAGIVLLSGFLAPSCAHSIAERAKVDPIAEAGPRPIKNESPHVELKLSHTVVRPGFPVTAKAYGRGDLKGGWRCVYVQWATDETGWQGDGTPPGAQCGEEGETWIWTKGPFRFLSPGEHRVCIEAYTRRGWLIGTRTCETVNVVRLQ